MNTALQQIVHLFSVMPPSRKLLMAAVALTVLGGFGLMFFWANRIEYQPVFTGLAAEDAAQIVEKLKEQRIPYRLEGGGSVILAPAERVYDIRLSMAGSGIPKGGAVGFEIFNQTEFGTTEFVQKLNFQRALQGELARTIRDFREVSDAKVMIVMPKESVFVEESRPPSASVLLKLRAALSPEKVSAVVHLVASAVEGLTPERVTVVDTLGKVLSKGGGEEHKAGSPAAGQLEYRKSYEQDLAHRIQTMLEGIVGKGRAIVRVSAEMDFDQVAIDEEIYDPDSQVARSQQSLSETADRKSSPGANVSSVDPVNAAGAGYARETADGSSRQEETVNYEISRTVKRTSRPVGSLKRLSVAVVLDGKYVSAEENGNTVRQFEPRTAEELAQFTKIVKNAMGYSTDREDQVSVESFPFSDMQDLQLEKPQGLDWVRLVRQFGRSALNVLLVLLVFFFVVRPLLRAFRDLKTEERAPALADGLNSQAAIANEQREALPAPAGLSSRQQAAALAQKDVEKSAGLIKGWLNESRS
jgi:flagellar M-ring protein FliF